MRFGGTSIEDGTDIAISESGHVYATGYFKFDAGFGIDSLEQTVTSNGHDDVFLLKLDSLGSVEWIRSFGGTGRDRGKAIAIDSYENVYVGGQFFGEVDLDPGLDTFNVQGYSSNSVDWFDGFVSKFDSSGNFIHGYQLGGTSGNVSDLIIESDDDFYVTGSFNDTSDLDPGIDTLFASCNWGSASFIQKLDNEFELIWAKHWGGWAINSSSVHANYLIPDSFGNILCAGSFSGPIDFNPEEDTLLLNGNGGFLSKFDSEGNFVWVNEEIAASSIVPDHEGNLYLAGSFTGVADIDPSGDVFHLNSNGGSDIFVSKIDSSANLIWALSMGGGANERIYSLQRTTENELIFSGTYYDAFDIDPGIDSLVLTPPSAGYIGKIDSSLDLEWAVNIGSTIGDVPAVIRHVRPNSIYTIGHFMGTGDFDPETTSVEMTSFGHWDVFIHKMTYEDDDLSTIYELDNITFHVYPNPSNGTYELEFGSRMQPDRVKIWNSSGLLVSEIDVEENTIKLQVTIEGSSGVYYLEVIDAFGTKAIRKVIKA